MEHSLKIWPQFFKQHVCGVKTFEIRIDNRPFKYRVNDILWLREWVPATELFTGRSIRRLITHVYQGTGLEPGYVIISIKPVPGDADAEAKLFKEFTCGRDRLSDPG